MDNSVKITKLSNAENWPLTQFQMKVILISFDSSGLITGEWKKPSLKQRKKKKLTRKQELDGKSQKLNIDWNRADGKCQKLLQWKMVLYRI